MPKPVLIKPVSPKPVAKPPTAPKNAVKQGVTKNRPVWVPARPSLPGDHGSQQHLIPITKGKKIDGDLSPIYTVPNGASAQIGKRGTDKKGNDKKPIQIHRIVRRRENI